MRQPRECCVCGRLVKSYTMVKNVGCMCQKHQHQWYKKGKITDPSPHSKYDLNNFIDCGDHYKIELRKPTEGYKIVGYALIDKDDYEKCKNIRWRLVEHKGALDYKDVESGEHYKGTVISLHRHIMNNPEGYVVDHKNGDTLDNRKSNLRVCSQKENVRNKTKLSNCNTSGINGVSKDNRKGRKTNWIAEIKTNYTKIYIAAYVDLEDAVYARYVAEHLLFKEFRASTNDELIKDIIKDCTNENRLKIKNKVVSRIKARLPQFEIDFNILNNLD